MWLRRKSRFRRTPKFFRITFRHDNLSNYFQTNFAMMQHHKYNLTELDNLIPWEKSLYVNMLIRHIEEENEKLKQQMANRRK
jgi:hypothetical protein